MVVESIIGFIHHFPVAQATRQAVVLDPFLFGFTDTIIDGKRGVWFVSF
jgi:hypothetical protein